METLHNYLDFLFMKLPYNAETVRAKDELWQMMEDKYTQIRDEGKSEEEAAATVIAEFGSLEEIADELGIRDMLRNSDGYQGQTFGSTYANGGSSFSQSQASGADSFYQNAYYNGSTVNGETTAQSKEKKKADKNDDVYYKNDTARTIMSVYWSTITCIYLCWSFITFNWAITWVIWPVAAILHTILKNLLGTPLQED